MQVGRTSVFEACGALISAAVHVTLALLSPTIWALVWGGVITSAAMMVGSFFLVPDLRHRFLIDRYSAREIIGFGKWIFISSIIYFLATNFDRLFVGKTLPLAVVGIYGVARSLAEVLTLLVSNFGNLIIFPGVAAATDEPQELRRRLAPLRGKAVFSLCGAVTVFALCSDIIIGVLYDARYHAAAAILPILAVGVWFSMLSSLNEAVLMGLRRPAYSATANALKLVCLLAALPVGIGALGVIGAAWALTATELVKFITVSVGLRRHGVSFILQDLSASAIVVAAVFFLTFVN